MSKAGFALALLAGAAAAHAGDAFDGLKCDADIAKAIVGRTIPNEPVAGIEKRHAAIQLKHEGSEEIDDPLFYEAWTICGSSYHVLLKKDVIKDAVKADHSKAAPAFLGSCEENGKPTEHEVLAILKPTGADGKNQLPAASAWRIDYPSARFVPIDAANLMCPHNGIATADGGP
ncbi:MAG TPA: hypothetical protein VFV97_06405 [Rhodanobacteraceae bacterium]|nr:hypothetical protein [Rhodanobacteraceae bacterium]